MSKKEIKTVNGPDFMKYVIPIIEVLKELGGSGNPSEVTDLIIDKYNISEAELERKNKNGGSTVKNRIAWARFYMVKGGILDSSKRGVWSFKGNLYENLSEKTIPNFFKTVHEQFEIEKATTENHKKNDLLENEIAEKVEDENYKEKLLTILKELPPEGFEKLCQRLLRESGFTQVKVTGKTGDGGIDGYGVLELNPLMSFKVLFQSKRYKDVVSTDKVRDFRGAMAGRADKGIIITTGRFTQDAKYEAVRDGVPPIELVDGDKLISMFEKLEFGLIPRTVYDIDLEFFKEFTNETQEKS
ncbi:MAG: restriction endonuclease [Fibrobacteres bacterium]|nr:restriction endonuclease [Fibrobacterota bacterium]